MIEHFIINLHLVPFYILFVSGFGLLVFAPLHYMFRIKTWVLNPFHLPRYNTFERRVVIWGVVLSFVGLIGLMIISEEYGYKRVFTDIHGNKTIEYSKPPFPFHED